MTRTARSDRASAASGSSLRGAKLWVLVIVAATVTGLLIAQSAIVSAAVFVLLALSAVALANREIALGAVLACSLLILGAIAHFGVPSQAALLTKLLIALFALGVLVDWERGMRPDIPVTFIALAALVGVSAIFGSSDRLLAAQAVGAYLAAPIAYLAIVNSKLEIPSLRRLSLLVAGIIALQVPIMIAQAPFVGNVDDIGGTFGLGGSTQISAIVFGIAWTVAVALLTKKRAWWLIPIGAAISAALIVNQAKAGFLFMGAGTIVVGLVRALANPRKGITQIAIYGGLGIAAVLSLYYGYVFFPNQMPGGASESFFWTHWLSNPSAIMGYLFIPDQRGTAARLGGTSLALAQAQSLADLLIGHGPGMLSGSALTGDNALANSALNYALAWATSLTRFVLEVGLLGIAAYLAAIATAVGAVIKAWRPRHDEWSISVAAAAAGAAAVYISGALYHAPWTIDAISVTFWCLLGIAVKWGRLRAAEPMLEAPAQDKPAAVADVEFPGPVA